MTAIGVTGGRTSDSDHYYYYHCNYHYYYYGRVVRRPQLSGTSQLTLVKSRL